MRLARGGAGDAPAAAPAPGARGDARGRDPATARPERGAARRQRHRPRARARPQHLPAHPARARRGGAGRLRSRDQAVPPRRRPRRPRAQRAAPGTPSPELAQPELDRLSRRHGVTAIGVKVVGLDHIVVVAISRSDHAAAAARRRRQPLPGADQRHRPLPRRLRRSSLERARARFRALRWDRPPALDAWRAEIEATRVSGYAVDEGDYLRRDDHRRAGVGRIRPRRPRRRPRGRDRAGQGDRSREARARPRRRLGWPVAQARGGLMRGLAPISSTTPAPRAPACPSGASVADGRVPLNG